MMMMVVVMVMRSLPCLVVEELCSCALPKPLQVSDETPKSDLSHAGGYGCAVLHGARQGYGSRLHDGLSGSSEDVILSLFVAQLCPESGGQLEMLHTDAWGLMHAMFSPQAAGRSLHVSFPIASTQSL